MLKGEEDIVMAGYYGDDASENSTTILNLNTLTFRTAPEPPRRFYTSAQSVQVGDSFWAYYSGTYEWHPNNETWSRRSDYISTSYSATPITDALGEKYCSGGL